MEELVRHFKDELLTPVFRRWICAKDGCCGEMKTLGFMNPTSPPQYPHCCDKCSRQEIATTKYPRVAYLPLEGIIVEK